MTKRTLKAAFFGSFPASYILASNVVDFRHAYCEPSYEGAAVFNTVLAPHLPELRQFQTLSEMVETACSWYDLDVLVVAGFAYRLPLEVIQQFKWVINMHTGDLFTNRGATPLATDLLKRNPFLTTSLHFIDSEQLDAGPFISSTRFPAQYGQNYLANQSRADQHGGMLLIEILTRLGEGQEAGSMNWIPQAGSYKPRVPTDVIQRLVNAPSIDSFLEHSQGFARM